jgi:hypothetical protein
VNIEEEKGVGPTGCRCFSGRRGQRRKLEEIGGRKERYGPVKDHVPVNTSEGRGSSTFSKEANERFP